MTLNTCFVVLELLSNPCTFLLIPGKSPIFSLIPADSRVETPPPTPKAAKPPETTQTPRQLGNNQHAVGGGALGARQAGRLERSVVTRFVAQTGGAESTVPPLPVARCLAVCAPHDLSVGQVDARRGRRASGSRARTIQEVRLPSLFYCNDSRVPRGLVGRLPTACYRR